MAVSKVIKFVLNVFLWKLSNVEQCPKYVQKASKSPWNDMELMKILSFNKPNKMNNREYWNQTNTYKQNSSNRMEMVLIKVRDHHHTKSDHA